MALFWALAAAFTTMVVWPLLDEPPRRKATILIAGIAAAIAFSLALDGVAILISEQADRP